MNAQRWSFVDKSGWGPGPWQDEPDKAQWTDPATGLPCLIVRNIAGALCGYVGVSQGHPAYGRDYGTIDLPEGVHGGLSFADGCQADGEHGICHVVEPGEDDAVWWLGFDCAHAFDRRPAMEERLRGYGISAHAAGIGPGWGETYRTLAYVTAECARLAAQLVQPQL